MIKGIRALWLAAVATLLVSCATTATDGYALYDTVDEPKALGMRVQVSYPAGWQVEEDKARPTIIRTFRHEKAGYTEYLLLQAMALGEDAEILFADEGEFDHSPRRAKWMHVLGSVSGTRVTNLKAITHQGHQAVQADLAVTQLGTGQPVYLASRMLMVKKSDKMMILTCGVNGPAKASEKVDALQKDNTDSLCRDYVDSLKFIE